MDVTTSGHAEARPSEGHGERQDGDESPHSMPGKRGRSGSKAFSAKRSQFLEVLALCYPIDLHMFGWRTAPFCHLASFCRNGFVSAMPVI
jgi:hypothetical protein